MTRSPTRKKAYKSPRLTKYGKVAKLTAKTGPQADGVGGHKSGVG